MTTPEMITAFNTLKDLYQAPYYDETDILQFLNNAVISFVDDHFPYSTDDRTDRRFQKTQRSVDAIYTLIKSQTLVVGQTNITQFHSKAKAYGEIPADYRHFFTCEIGFGSTTTTWAEKISPVTFDELNLLMTDPFSAPNDTDNVYIVWHGTKILVFSATPPTTFRLIYCKNPIKIDESTDCDLPLLSHEAIVKKAVLEAIAVAEEDVRAKLSPLLNN